jgi:hypothetical protein
MLFSNRLIKLRLGLVAGILLLVFASVSLLFSVSARRDLDSTAGIPAITNITAVTAGPLTRITIYGTMPMSYSLSRRDERTILIDIPGADASRLSRVLTVTSPLVESITVEGEQGVGAEPRARLIVSLRLPARERLNISESNLILELSPRAGAQPFAVQPSKTESVAKESATNSVVENSASASRPLQPSVSAPTANKVETVPVSPKIEKASPTSTQSLNPPPSVSTQATKPAVSRDVRPPAQAAQPVAEDKSRAVAQNRSVAQQRAGFGALSGQVFDTLGGLIVGATVTIIDSSGAEKTVTTDNEGKYSVSGLAPGRYTLRATAQGFADYENPGLEIGAGRRQPFNIELGVAIGKQEVTISGDTPLRTSLMSRVLTSRDIRALPRSPGGLSAALRALAVPSTSPQGPQIYVNGFPGGRLPPTDSIREIRINENPFSAEYSQPGFGRVEILTKPGTDKFQFGAYYYFTDESLNSRNPFSPERAPFQGRQLGGNASGPFILPRSSFFVDFENYRADDNAIINATVLDPLLNIVPLNLSLLTPERRTSFSPRFDFQLSENNTLVARYAYTRTSTENSGVGDFSLASRAYNTSNTQQVLQLTDTAILSPTVINETRFQFLRNRTEDLGGSLEPTIRVPEAFIGGGAQRGLSFNDENRWELQNYTIWSRGRHELKFGAQLRGVRLANSSQQDFAGTFSFTGGLAPVLDANNQIVLDPNGRPVIAPITGIERYRRTLLFQRQGLQPDAVRNLGGGATQFSLTAGEAEQSVSQYDVSVYAQDEWKLKDNLTVSLGLRYERQSNISSNFNFAPRVAFAWSPDGGGGQAKTVVRGGLGIFYERFSENYLLQARRFNGENQQQFIVSDPNVLNLFPGVPTAERLTDFQLQPSVTRIAGNLQAPYLIQSSIGIERELPLGLSLAATYINSRSLRLLRSRNINAPLPGSFEAVAGGLRPFTDEGDIFQYESNGRFNQNQLTVNAVHRFREVMTLWATYILNKTLSDTDGADTFPISSYDLSTEYGRSALDVRHSFYFGGWINGPWGLSLSPLVFMRSGVPFNITIGRDINGDNLFTERPAFATDLSRPSVMITDRGAFDLDPLPGQEIIPRNYGTGPSFFSANLGISKSYSFGRESKSSARSGAAKTQSPGINGGNFGWLTGRRYTLTFTLQFENLFNRTNPGLPVGNLSSPLFGQSYSAAGLYGMGNNPGGNRRIQLQVYLSF